VALFYLPTRIVTGDGSLESLGEVAAPLGERAVLFHGRSAAAAGHLEQAVSSLRRAGVAAEPHLVGGAEPTLAAVQQAIEQLGRCQGTVVIGLGGGSILDLAKAAAGLAPLPGSPREYFAGRPLEGPGLPWIAIPTTSGTGAEVTTNAVLIDERTGAKGSLRSDSWFARAAILDPLLTISMPPSVTAQSGADALCQALESFVSIGAMPVTDALCREALRLLGPNLRRAYEDGQDLAARRAMHYGSLLAGMALTNARLGAVHGIAHPLGGHYGLPHGLICGLLLPYVMEWNLPACAARYAEAGKLMGLLPPEPLEEKEAAAATVAAVRELLQSIGIPQRLSELGLRELNYELVSSESMSSSMKHNPRPMSEHDVANLLRRAL
jgi:alcohol dehydrogenase